MATVNIDQQFVEYVVKSLVNNPDAVKVDRSVDEKGVLLELTVDPEDLGRVIGKRGATAQSMRTLLRALGTKNEARYNLKIVDNGEPRPPRDDHRTSDDRSQSSDSSSSTAKDDDDVTSDTVEDVEVDTDEAEEIVEEEAKPVADEQDDLAAKTRKELADLDDLDV